MNSPDASQVSSIAWGSPGRRRLRGAPYLSRRPLPYRTQPTPEPEPKPTPRQEREIPPRNNDVRKPLFQPASASPAYRIEDESGLDELFREEASAIPPHDFEYEPDDDGAQGNPYFPNNSPRFETRYREASVASTGASSDIVLLPSRARSGHIAKIVESDEEEEDELESSETESEAETPPPPATRHQSSYRSARINVKGVQRSNNRKLFDKALGKDKAADDISGDLGHDPPDDVFSPKSNAEQIQRQRPPPRRTSLRYPPVHTSPIASPDERISSPIPSRIREQTNKEPSARNDSHNVPSRTSSTNVHRHSSAHRCISRHHVSQQHNRNYIYEAVYTRPQPGHELRGGRTPLEFGYVVPTPAPAEPGLEMEDILGRISLKDSRAPIIGRISQSAFAKSTKRKRADSEDDMEEEGQSEVKQRKPLGELRSKIYANETNTRIEGNVTGPGEADPADQPDFADRILQKNALQLSRSSKKKKGQAKNSGRRKSDSLKGNYPKLALGFASDRKTRRTPAQDRSPMTPRTPPCQSSLKQGEPVQALSHAQTARLPPANPSQGHTCNNMPGLSPVPCLNKSQDVVVSVASNAAAKSALAAKTAASPPIHKPRPLKSLIPAPLSPSLRPKPIQTSPSAPQATARASQIHQHPAAKVLPATASRSEGARKLSKLMSTQTHVEEHVPASRRRLSVAGKLLKPVAEAVDPSKFKLPILVPPVDANVVTTSGIVEVAATTEHVAIDAHLNVNPANSGVDKSEGSIRLPGPMNAMRNSKDSTYTLAGPSTAWTTESELRAKESTTVATSITTEHNGNSSVYTLAGSSTAWTSTALLAERNRNLRPSSVAIDAVQTNSTSRQRDASIFQHARTNLPHTTMQQTVMNEMYSTPELPPPGQIRSSYTASIGTEAFPTPSPPDELYCAATTAYQYQTPRADTKIASNVQMEAELDLGMLGMSRSINSSPSPSPNEAEIPLVTLQQKLEYGRKIVQVTQETTAGANLPNPVVHRRRMIRREETEQELVSDLHDWAMREAEQYEV